MTNPVLIEVTRGSLVESTHTGAVALADTSGRLLAALGDVKRPVFARSAIKALQCLPLIETGAADRFGFGPAEIALACASHSGSERHTTMAGAMLEKIGLAEVDLKCGAHLPRDTGETRALLLNGGRPNQLHNNCSGKHAGMLATAVHLGEPLPGYFEVDHPVQQRIRKTLVEVTGVELGSDALGIDGCSVPTWALPLADMARTFARFGTAEGFAPVRRTAIARIVEACWEEPELVAGTGRTDSVVMARLPGRVFMKTGAEGVYCGAFPELGLGFALKVDDGAARAAAGAAMALIERLVPAARNLIDKRIVRNWRGIVVGSNRSSAEFERALDRIKL